MVSSKIFGRLSGEDIFLFTLENEWMKVELTNYGATIVSIFTPGKNGKPENIVAGFDNLGSYLQDHPYFGCMVGRYANRIAGGSFSIDGVTYQLAVNNGTNHLHGGLEGFNRKVWKAELLAHDTDHPGLQLFYRSRDGEENYPGNLDVTVTYSINKENELRMVYRATTDQPTVLNLTNHSYFNLSGFREDTIRDHVLRIYADRYTEKNEQNVPNGIFAPVAGTPLDFTKARKIGERLHELERDNGYDHNYILDNRGAVQLAAELSDERSERKLRVLTNQPGLQLYTSNFFDGSLTGYQGKPYGQHGAVALETQDYPDAPNHPNFPNTVLRPGEVYERTTVFQLS